MEYIIEFKSIGGEPGTCGFTFSVTKEDYRILLAGLLGKVKLEAVPCEKGGLNMTETEDGDGTQTD